MKNTIKYLIYTFMLLMMPIVVFASTQKPSYSYRGKEMNVVYIIGIALLVIRIVVPLLLIIIGMIGLVKAMTKNDDRDIKAELKKLTPKLIAAIVIFILPSIIALILGLIKQDALWEEYSACLLRPSSCRVTLWEEAPNVPQQETTVDSKDGTTSPYEKGYSQVSETGLKIVAEAMKYKKKNVGTDCSGFVKKILKKLNLLDKEMGSTSARCLDANRGSYGMYLLYKQRGKVVWERSSSAKTKEEAIKTFPGGCQPGDVIFYTYGAGSKVNDCVKHIVIYTGYENGKHMIIDSNTDDNIAKYRGINDIFWSAIPLACARPY